MIFKGLSLLIALAVMLGMSPLRHTGSAGATAALAQAADLGSHGHGHAHTDDEDLAAQGHERQDHSHVLFGLAPHPAPLSVAPPGELLRIYGECRGTSDPRYRLDRPPCLLLVA